MVPQRLAKIGPNVSDGCFRECVEVGTLKHIRWECLIIKQFCSSVYQLIYTVQGHVGSPLMSQTKRLHETSVQVHDLYFYGRETDPGEGMVVDHYHGTGETG